MMCQARNSTSLGPIVYLARIVCRAAGDDGLGRTVRSLAAEDARRLNN